MSDGLARQVLGQWPSDWMAAWFGRRFRCRRDLGWLLRLSAGGILLESADQQFQLFDVAIELLRRTAEPGPPQNSQLRFQFLDMRKRQPVILVDGWICLQ